MKTTEYYKSGDNYDYSKMQSRKDTINVDIKLPPSIVVYGPKGCGKTRNALKIATAYGLRRIFDNYSGTFEDLPKTSSLILTNMDLANIKHPIITVVSFKDALIKTGQR